MLLQLLTRVLKVTPMLIHFFCEREEIIWKENVFCERHCCRTEYNFLQVFEAGFPPLKSCSGGLMRWNYSNKVICWRRRSWWADVSLMTLYFIQNTPLEGNFKTRKVSFMMLVSFHFTEWNNDDLLKNLCLQKKTFSTWE